MIFFIISPPVNKYSTIIPKAHLIETLGDLFSDSIGVMYSDMFNKTSVLMLVK